jgi:hypothetical protein
MPARARARQARGVGRSIRCDGRLETSPKHAPHTTKPRPRKPPALCFRLPIRPAEHMVLLGAAVSQARVQTDKSLSTTSISPAASNRRPNAVLRGHHEAALTCFCGAHTALQTRSRGEENPINSSSLIRYHVASSVLHPCQPMAQVCPSLTFVHPGGPITAAWLSTLGEASGPRPDTLRATRVEAFP